MNTTDITRDGLPDRLRALAEDEIAGRCPVLSPGNGHDLLAAADMLEFLLNQMQMHSPQMNGAHSYRFISSGWPMNHCKGPSAEAAVKAAMAEVERARRERHAP